MDRRERRWAGRRAALLLAACSTVGSTLAQTAPPAVCYSDREVAFASTAEGISIAGTLSVPTRSGRLPAVLMITGNGPHTRDQVISGTPMYAMIADHLARRGMAVLRTDARGYGASSGPADWELFTTADRIIDNRAALKFLREQNEVDPERIVLFGHSEGAMIAAALAASDAKPALTVLLAPSALPGSEVFARQFSDSLLRRGASAATADAVHRELLRFAAFLVSDRENRPRFEAIALDFLAAHGVPQDQLDPALAQSLLEGYLKAPWYWHFVAYDPREALTRIDSPVIAVFAGADENVPWRAHLPVLVEALSRGRVSDLTTHVLPDQDHFLLELEGRRVAEHEPGRMSVAAELFEALDAALMRRKLGGNDCATLR